MPAIIRFSHTCSSRRPTSSYGRRRINGETSRHYTVTRGATIRHDMVTLMEREGYVVGSDGHYLRWRLHISIVWYHTAHQSYCIWSAVIIIPVRMAYWRECYTPATTRRWLAWVTASRSLPRLRRILWKYLHKIRAKRGRHERFYYVEYDSHN